jgi:hypothetical protein
VSQFKLMLCQPCAAKLRAILAAEGEETMARKVPKVLCRQCTARLPESQRGLPWVLRRPS